MNALTTRIASLSTDQLVEVAMRMALGTSNEAIMVCTAVDRELEARMTEEDFLAHLATIEALWDVAA